MNNWQYPKLGRTPPFLSINNGGTFSTISYRCWTKVNMPDVFGSESVLRSYFTVVVCTSRQIEHEGQLECKACPTHAHREKHVVAPTSMSASWRKAYTNGNGSLHWCPHSHCRHATVCTGVFFTGAVTRYR